ncbi:hypothetical protein, partial [Streptomyces asiaticus]|uniref:hypothetical protein n=1 Tax=Streptomyces asiaticus TaxID=114695 RepID=UPI003829A8DF
ERTLPSKPFHRFLRALPFGVSNLTRSDFRSFSIRIPFPVAAWKALPFGVFSTLADDHPPNLIGFA